MMSIKMMRRPAKTVGIACSNAAIAVFQVHYAALRRPGISATSTSPLRQVVQRSLPELWGGEVAAANQMSTNGTQKESSGLSH